MGEFFGVLIIALVVIALSALTAVTIGFFAVSLLGFLRRGSDSTSRELDGVLQEILTECDEHGRPAYSS